MKLPQPVYGNSGVRIIY